MLKIRDDFDSTRAWFTEAELDLQRCEIEDGKACALSDPEGRALGVGILDRRDPQSIWRRFSWDSEASFNLDYLVETMEAAVGRRPEESCQRLIHSDADYLPGLIVDCYGDILMVRTETAATQLHLEAILEILHEGYQPREIVVRNENPGRAAFGLTPEIRTLSGNPLKGFWIEIDDLQYRLDPTNPEKPLFPLAQREQHSLVGSLCGNRTVLQVLGESGAFALQALRQEAKAATVLQPNPETLKTIRANSQKNNLPLGSSETDLLAFLKQAEAGSYDAIILNLTDQVEYLESFQAEAFRILPSGGLLASYTQGSGIHSPTFENVVARASAEAGREARIFANTRQPFDFPVLLNCPASSTHCGIILQVE
jgi:23S rRNA (cytosine1962-C5)-methyltransferase